MFENRAGRGFPRLRREVDDVRDAGALQRVWCCAPSRLEGVPVLRTEAGSLADGPSRPHERLFMIFMKPLESKTSSSLSASVDRNSSQVITSIRLFLPFVN